MSMAPSRIAAAGGRATGSVPTIIRISTSEETSLTYGIPLVAIAPDTPASDRYITIDWGDGTVKTYPVDPSHNYISYAVPPSYELTHSYDLPGKYRVIVDSRATDIMLGVGYLNNSAYKTYAEMVEAVEQWGPSIRLGSVLGSDRFILNAANNKYIATFGACAKLKDEDVALVEFAAVGPYAMTGSQLTTLRLRTTASTVIHNHAFMYSDVTDVTWWPSEQTTVPEWCFYGAKSLTSLAGMELVTAAEELAFFGCSSLTSLDGLDALKSAGDSCFLNCVFLSRLCKLDQYEAPVSGSMRDLTTLGSGCFAGCTALTSLVSLPPNVTVLPYECFARCTGLEKIYIPAQVKTIRARAFRDCGATLVAFYEPAIMSGSTVVRPVQYTTPTRIDQAAFIGQAEYGEFKAPGMTAEQLRAIKGALSNSGTIHDETNPMSVSWLRYFNGILDETKVWFTCDNPTFAPWGLGRSWTLSFSGSDSDPANQAADHNSIICADFLTAPGDNAPLATGSTKLECMEAAVAYNSGGVRYFVTPQFSPYGEASG